MLVEFAAALVAVGIILLIVGILIARQYTLRSKLLTAFMFIVLVSLGTLAIIDNYLMRDSLTSSATKTLVASAKQYSNQIDRFNSATLEAVLTASRLPALMQYLTEPSAEVKNKTTVSKILDVLQSDDSYAISYALLDAKGINQLDTFEQSQGDDESKEAYFQHVMDKGGVYRSSLIFAKNNDAVLFFSSVVKDDDGNAIGVLRAKYNADVLSYIVKSARGYSGLGSFAVLLDENMLRLVHGRKPELRYSLARTLNNETMSTLRSLRKIPDVARLDTVEQPQWVDKVAQSNYESDALVKPFFGMGDELFVATVSQLNSAPWRIVLAQPRDIVLQPVADQTSIALFIAGIVVIFVTMIVFGTTQFLLGPVRRLTAIVHAVAKGDLKKKATIEANDEVGGLAGAFNSMTENIQSLVFNLETEVHSHQMTADHLRKLSLAIEQSPVSVMITDLNGVIEYVNPQFCRTSGYSEEEVIGKTPNIMNSGETPEYQFKNLWSAIQSGHSWHGELYNKKRNGDLFWESVTVSPIKTKEGVSTHYLAIKEDITLRKDYEEKLLYQATYDNLTDLPNRSLAFDRLQQAITIAARENRRMSVLYIDFDHFKNINDTLGHTAGDKFLVLMAERLKSCVRDVDTVARLGGDEYLIVLTGIGESSSVNTLEYQATVLTRTEKILSEVARPFFINEKEFSITASIGIAIYPYDGDDPHVLLRNSDTAMYRSKRKGRNTMEMYAPEMNDTVVKRVEIESKLIHALENERFHLMYQPLVDSTDKKLIGAEALLRWNDKELGDVPPEVFIPFAEESGLIVDISNWVIEQACKDLKQWHEITGEENMYAAINLSSRQFRGGGLVDVVGNALKKNNIPGHCVELEITERMLMKDVSDVIVMLNQFKEMGIHLSIDDFGTGYSSLSYLKRFPIDTIKIDRSFIRDVTVDPDDAAIAQAIIAMGRSLKLHVIAEGVETQEQLAFLREQQCHGMQGYLFSRPVPAEEITPLLTKTLSEIDQNE